MQKAVFLDRDGTINTDFGYVHTVDQFKLIDGVVEALQIFKSLGYKLIIISNQSGIGRGYFTESEYLKFQDYILKLLDDKGASIDASYYCPHIGNANCSCRKPKTGLFIKAAIDFDIDFKESIAIGDRYRDLVICSEKGVRGFFIRGTESEHEASGVTLVDSLLDAAMIIKNEQYNAVV